MTEKFGFIGKLEEELEKNFHYDFEMNWDKKNFALEVSFLLEVENLDGTKLVDADGVENEEQENILYEDAVLFYNPTKTKFKEDNYLVAIPYDEKGLSKEFIAYFVEFLQQTVDDGLSDLMDFLESDEEEFSIIWNEEKFDDGDDQLVETEFYKYPRY